MNLCLMMNSSSKRQAPKDWAPHNADIEKEALLKCPLKPNKYLRYLDDVFILWPNGNEEFSEFLNIFNTHQLTIKFKSSVCIDSVNYLNSTVFKDPKNKNTSLTKVFLKPIYIHQVLLKDSFHLKNIFKGLLR